VQTAWRRRPRIAVNEALDGLGVARASMKEMAEHAAHLLARTAKRYMPSISAPSRSPYP
jgi:hypothetical protein